MDARKWQFRVPEETDEKLKTISKRNNRSKHAQALEIIQQYIRDYEKINGTIEIKEDEKL